MNVKHWLTTTDHKDVGILYLVTSLVFFFIGGLLALVVRTQLAFPESDILTGSLYNQAVTMHGAVMALFFISPFSFAFANYLVPLQIGARDLAFPRINALSFWLYLAGGLVAASGFLLGGAADVGWTFYSPLTSIEFSPGLGVDLAGIGLLLLVISVTVSTINFLATMVTHRAPGITWYKMPLFSWSILFTLLIMLFAFPALAVGLLMLVADRHLGGMFFSAFANGSELWEHIFWFFGHPEVYIILLPGLGAVGEVISTFSRRPLYGKKYILWAIAAATGLSFIVWMHHMFTTGADPTMRKIMTITTETISIPFGVVFLCYIATLWGGRISLRGPMLFAMGFIVLFLLGGLTGVFLSSVAIDYNLRGSYFVVAHFHYTLVGGAVVGMIAGLYYWFPKMSGRMLKPGLGKLHFWLTFVSFNLIFLPLFIAGDMPRRVYTYDTSGDWWIYNVVATIGAFIFGFAQLVMVYNLWWSHRNGAPAGPDPWGGEGLEWTVPSPPPIGNFGARMPTIEAPTPTPRVPVGIDPMYETKSPVRKPTEKAH